MLQRSSPIVAHHHDHRHHHPHGTKFSEIQIIAARCAHGVKNKITTQSSRFCCCCCCCCYLPLTSSYARASSSLTLSIGASTTDRGASVILVWEACFIMGVYYTYIWGEIFFIRFISPSLWGRTGSDLVGERPGSPPERIDFNPFLPFGIKTCLLLSRKEKILINQLNDLCENRVLEK